MSSFCPFFEQLTSPSLSILPKMNQVSSPCSVLYLLSPTACLPLSALRCLLLTPVYCCHSSAARVCILTIYVCAHYFFVLSSADTSPLRICEGFAIMSEHLTCVCLVSRLTYVYKNSEIEFSLRPYSSLFLSFLSHLLCFIHVA